MESSHGDLKTELLDGESEGTRGKAKKFTLGSGTLKTFRFESNSLKSACSSNYEEQGRVSRQLSEAIKEQARPSLLRRWLLATWVLYLLGVWWYGHRYRGWPWYDSLYFLVVSVSTVGFGDLTVQTDHALSCVFASLYLLIGVGIIGFVTGNVLAEYLEKHEDWMSERKSKDQRWSLLFGMLEVLTAVFVGVAGFSYFENESISRSLYWAVVTSTTVGYGDVVPKTVAGKLFASTFIPISMALFLSGIQSFAQIPIEQRRQALLAQFSKQSFTEDMLAHLSSSQDMKDLGLSQHDSCITRNEFTLYVLYALGKVTEDDFDGIRSMFDQLDTTGNGLLLYEDLQKVADADDVDALPPRIPSSLWRGASFSAKR